METKTNAQLSLCDRQPRIIKTTDKIQIRAAENLLSFPQEIIAEILSRLPFKSLLKFMCVSKSWCSLIPSKHFIEAHLRISRKDTNFNRHRIISTVLLPCYSSKQYSLQSLMCGLVDDVVDLDYPMKDPNNAVRIVGCCNGVVCFAINGKHFFLWNPATREYKKLPDTDDRMKRGLFITKYGFGFDGSNEDYRVVGILSGFGNARRYDTMVKIYSLRTNSWKRIDVFKDGLPFDDTGRFVSGKLHWGRRVGFTWDIVSLDLGSDQCGKVEQPAYVACGFSPTLGVLGGCLCVLCDFPQISVDVWVLKQYGVRESWDKVVCLPYPGDPWKGPHSTPMSLGPKGEILLVYGFSFIVYDSKNNRFSHPKMRNFDTFLEVDVCIESFVPLVHLCEPERQNQSQ